MTIAYKGMDKDMKCKGFQYEVGKEYSTDKSVKLCEHGFHACENPLDVFDYYEPANSRFFEVEQSGAIQKQEDGDTKIVSSKINIKAELTLSGIIKAGVDFILERAKEIKTNTGYGSVATNIGDRSAATNTGDRSAATNTGDSSAATNTGDSSAATNTGYSSAATNTGYRSAATNTGYSSAATNTGDSSAATNTGDSSVATNTGDSSAATNTGDSSVATNTGDSSAACVDGKESAAFAFGIYAKAKAKQGWIIIVDWQQDENCNWFIKDIHSAKVGGKIKDKEIQSDVWYWFENGELRSGK